MSPSPCASLKLKAKLQNKLVDLKPHNQDVRFQFMNSALVLDKRVSLTYTHSRT